MLTLGLSALRLPRGLPRPRAPPASSPCPPAPGASSRRPACLQLWGRAAPRRAAHRTVTRGVRASACVCAFVQYVSVCVCARVRVCMRVRVYANAHAPACACVCVRMRVPVRVFVRACHVRRHASRGGPSYLNSVDSSSWSFIAWGAGRVGASLPKHALGYESWTLPPWSEQLAVYGITCRSYSGSLIGAHFPGITLWHVPVGDIRVQDSRV